ncbi:hypothetical protein WDU94_010139 [Cyamophila willieti]
MLEIIEQFDHCHRHNPKVVNVIMLEEKIMQLAFGLVAFTIIGGNVLCLIPKSDTEMERLRKIYEFRYPQNTFMIPVYLPFLDPSEPHVYILLWCVVFCMFFLLTSAFVVAMIFFPLLVLDLNMCLEIACQFVQLMGQEHRDVEGRLVFYTDIINNKYVMQNNEDADESSDDTFENDYKKRESEKAIRYLFSRHPKLYEYYYLRQVILLQKKLSNLRKMLDDFYRDLFYIISVNFLILFMMSVYNSFFCTHSQIIRFKIYAETLILVLTYFIFFTCGEVVANMNPSLARAAWFSHWYKCSIDTKRGMLLFLRSCQKMDYMLIFNLFELRFTLLVSTLRLSYSFFNVMNLRVRTRTKFI